MIHNRCTSSRAWNPQPRIWSQNTYYWLETLIMKIYSPTSKGFTIVEMVIAITIFSLMSVTITSVYIQTTYSGERMKKMRYLSETAREITERIADDIRTQWIADPLPFDPSYALWNTYDPLLGSEYLTIKSTPLIRYVYGKKTPMGISPCSDNYGGSMERTRSDSRIHCGLYRVIGTDYAGSMNLVDSFIPDELKKRVKLTNMRFYINGDGIITEKKVTLVFSLRLMSRPGVPPSLVSETEQHIQTTISERYFTTY